MMDYLIKIGQRKNKMSVLNVGRNKILHLICALIKNQFLYQKKLQVYKTKKV